MHTDVENDYHMQFVHVAGTLFVIVYIGCNRSVGYKHQLQSHLDFITPINQDSGNAMLFYDKDDDCSKTPVRCHPVFASAAGTAIQILH